MKKEPCKDCGAYVGHSPNCVSIDLDSAKEQLSLYYSLWKEKEIWTRNRIERHEKAAQMWKGKYYEVKHENNQLRKEINK